MNLTNLKKNISMVSAVLIINLFFDRITKVFAVQFLKDGPSHHYFYNTFVLKYAENSGAFLSMGADWYGILKYILLLGIPLVVCAVAIAYVLLYEKDKIRVIIITTIIAGGFGNIYDRLIYDFSVVDFMNFGIANLRTGILNVADLSITFGVLAFVLYEYKIIFKPKHENPGEQSDGGC